MLLSNISDCLTLRPGNCAHRALQDESKARLGVVECSKHELVQPFSVLHEKEGKRTLL